MPPKKGKKKQADDDWEAELGESLNEPKTDDVVPDAIPAVSKLDEQDEGGLMSQLGKGKKVD